MEQRKNWILVDRLFTDQSSLTDDGRDPLQRISSINRLNDRIQRRLSAAYTPYTGSTRVWPLPPVIPEEEDDEPSPTTSASSTNKFGANLLSSSGLPDLGESLSESPVMDERRRNTDESASPFETPRLVHEDAKNVASSRLEKLLRRKSTGHDTLTEMRINHGVVIDELKSLKREKEGDRYRRRSNSFDSASIDSSNELHNQQPNGSIEPKPEVRKKPTLLKRNSDFYRRCDVCALSPTTPFGTCPACQQSAGMVSFVPSGRAHPPTSLFAARSASFLQPSVTIEPYFPEKPRRKSVGPQKLPPELLSVDHLRPYKLFSTGAFTSSPKHFLPDPCAFSSKAAWNDFRHHSELVGRSSLRCGGPATAGTMWKIRPSTSMRSSLGGRVRMGERVVPTALCEFDFFAEEARRKARSRRRRKVVALTFCLLALALVVAAGVVLAAINY